MQLLIMQAITTVLASILLLLSALCGNSLIPKGVSSSFGIIFPKEEEYLLWRADSLMWKDESSTSSLTVRIVRGGGENNKKYLVKDSPFSPCNLKSFCSKISSALTKLFRPIKKPIIFQSSKERRKSQLEETLRKVPIKKVVVRNSTVLPTEVVNIASKRAGLFGRPLERDAVEGLARSLKQWYERNGFVLNSVTGISVQVDTQTAELEVEEPVSYTDPVEIICCQEMVINPKDGSLMTMKQYQNTLPEGTKIKKSDLNTTFKPKMSGGKTKPDRIASAMGLAAGKSFRWNAGTWSRIQKSGIFSKLLRVVPERMPDGTVQLQMFVEESQQRNLEYGVTKSEYTHGWGGEVDFSQRNLFGGGECLGVNIRKGTTRNGGASAKLQYLDEKFGMPGGYDLQVFSDYIGETKGKSDAEDSTAFDENHFGRKGVSFNLLRNSILEKYGVPSTAGACLERISAKGGIYESVGSTTLSLGPISKQLPLAARSNIFGKLTAGARLTDTSLPESNKQVLPFTSITATTRHTVPLAVLSKNTQPVILALQQAITISTSNIPRHEQKAHGVACAIRGYGAENERIANALVGTTELRFPLPRLQDAKILLFGDWCASKAPGSSSFIRRASVGVGIRKNFQGVPLKYDISYSKDGKLKAFFGFGPDFEA